MQILAESDFMKTNMCKKDFIKPALSILLLFNLAACSLVGNEKRAFQEKPFVSDEWIKGDAQTRGEMTRDLSKYDTVVKLAGKTQSELIKILGEPDKKTMGKYGHVRFGNEVEVWLYRIEPANAANQKIKQDSVQVFFSAEDKTVKDLTTGAMDEKPAYFPMVG